MQNTNSIFSKYFLVLFSVICFSSISQTEYMDYRSQTNPYYWKNRKPTQSYWQQDVHYNIKAELNDSSDIISGNEELTYWNNSPYTLSHVYFYLYSNAQTKDSYLSNLYRNNKYQLNYGKYRKNNLGTNVNYVLNNNDTLNTEWDNTVLRVNLKSPIKPGESTTFKLNFATYFDKETIRNRMKLFNSFGKKHYDIVHWYPRVAVIDQKFVWNTDQHMDHEFYGEFGSYYVEMTLPNNYIADGTGTLINEKEVVPDTLRKKLDISNFLKKPYNSAPSEIIKRTREKKTWKFSAINVHDFAMTADPNYRIGETNWNGVRCIALVQEPHAAVWHNASNYTAKIIEMNSSNIGVYPHPKMIVADAQDGMEYPMLTLCGGTDPDYRTLFVHEITHNWFQGMLGTNETYRAYMDEGFTQFYTADTYQYIDGPILVENKPQGKYIAKFTEPNRILDDEIYNSFYYNSVTKKEEVTLNTHADDFNGGIRHGGGYGQSYTKTAAMLKNLEYVLSRALFDKAMKHYFDQWRFCHPYPEDFRNSIIQYTGVDLNWFFDEWLETTKYIDYKIGRVKHKKNDVYEITFKRKGSMQMPLDFAVIDQNDSARMYHIPNTWFVKPSNANVLPRWIGWGPKLKTTYTATLNIGTKIKNVMIDPSHRLADVDMTNNSLTDNVDVIFDSHVYNPANWKKYQIRVRPSLWYNAFDGIKFGIYMNGDYLNSKHIFESCLWAASNIARGQWDEPASKTSYKKYYSLLSGYVDYKTSIHKLISKGNVFVQLKSLDGLMSGTIGLDRKINNDRTRIYTYFKAMQRNLSPNYYLIYAKEWNPNQLNSAIHIGLEHRYTLKKDVGTIAFNLRAAAFTKDCDFSAITLTQSNKHTFKKFTLNTRLFGQIGVGTKLASESMLYAAGANNEELMNNKYTRSSGFVPYDWSGYGVTTNHFSAGGGLNLRGFSGYLLASKNKDGSITYNYKGITGAAFNAELEFGKLFQKFNPRFLHNAVKLQPYLFSDAGIINTNIASKPNVLSDGMMDAGIGSALSIVRWGKLYNIKPLVIRFDFPLFINRLPYAEKDYFQFRWVVGVNRAF